MLIGPPTTDIALFEMNNYLIQFCNSPSPSDPLQFWEQRMHVVVVVYHNTGNVQPNSRLRTTDHISSF